MSGALQALATPQKPQAVVECGVKLARMAAVAEQANDLPATLDALSRLAATSNTGMLAHLVGLASDKRGPKCAPPGSCPFWALHWGSMDVDVIVFMSWSCIRWCQCAL